MSDLFGLTEDALTVLRGDVKGISGFMVGQWTYQCAKQLALHEGPITPDGVKIFAKDHKVNTKGVQIVRRKLRKAGLWDDTKGGLGQVFALDGSHLTPKKGDDVTKVVDQYDEKDESIQRSKVTSITKKGVVDVQSDLKKRSTQPSTPKGGQRLTADQLAQLLELPEEERHTILSLMSPKKPPARSKEEKQKILDEIGDESRTLSNFWNRTTTYVQNALKDLELFIEVAEKEHINEVLNRESLTPIAEILFWNPYVNKAQPDFNRADIAQLFIQSGFDYLSMMKIHEFLQLHQRVVTEAIELSHFLVKSFKAEDNNESS